MDEANCHRLSDNMRLSYKSDCLLFGYILNPYVCEKCGLEGQDDHEDGDHDDDDDDDDDDDEDKFKGFLPYYKWNALVDLEDLYYEEGGDPDRKPDSVGAWEKLIDLDPES